MSSLPDDRVTDEPPATASAADPARPDALLNRIALVMCGIAVVVAIGAWFVTGAWRHLVSAAGLACVAWVLARVRFSPPVLAWPPPEDGPAASRAETIVRWLGWSLIVGALAAHWLG